MPALPVLYDGWSLARQPNSPAALHLVELLALLPDEVRAIVAVPDIPFDLLPAHIETHLLATPDSPSGRLKWEQRILPNLAREFNAQILHLVGGYPALFASIPTILSPAGFAMNPLETRGVFLQKNLASRLREALGQGGKVRASGIFWPNDLKVPHSNIPLLSLPPVVHPAFNASSSSSQDDVAGLELPETYLLYHGPYTGQDLERLLNAWAWAARAIGENYPLLLVGSGNAEQESLEQLLNIYKPGKMVRPLPELSHSGLVWLYQHCSALFHPAPISPWGSPVRMALACGKPVVALESPLSDALVGPAAYLVPNDQTDTDTSRALGAALLTIIVEESVARGLTEAARQQVAGWKQEDFSTALLSAYRRFT